MTGASLMMASNANCADGVTVDHLGVNNTPCARGQRQEVSADACSGE